MRRACAIILFLVFTQYMIETAQAKPDPQAQNQNCGKHGDACDSNSDCCPQLRCHRYANRCQVKIEFPDPQ
ncbi:hypothetical protein PYW08_016018 [Mythimna loreyi]|uniref:Uncharacterized protein n=1 Tax=Mythimna loreyi TaxID=667449 RepID=A0ACC2QUA0_9NEOP|nr:hypothetical protein PYW08_016018 [Mythimna loreyi]